MPDTVSLFEFYKTMQTIRVCEEKLCAYIDNGEIKTPCHLYIGQEAVATGVCSNLTDADTIWGNHRSHGHYLAKGGNLQAMIDEIFCRNTGCSSGRGGSMHLVSPDKGIPGTVPIVAGTIPLAVGAALSEKLSSTGNIAVAFFGDGATEEGHVSESLNLASLYQLPILFVIENNLYSSHMHMSERRVQPDLLKFAEAHGIKTMRTDGNDVIEVSEQSKKIITDIRAGGGPAAIECMTFRWRGHVGPKWDEDVGVKRKGELSEWLPKDPIKKLHDTMVDSGHSHEELLSINREVEQAVDKAILQARSADFPHTDTLMDHVFSNS